MFLPFPKGSASWGDAGPAAPEPGALWGAVARGPLAQSGRLTDGRAGSHWQLQGWGEGRASMPREKSGRAESGRERAAVREGEVSGLRGTWHWQGWWSEGAGGTRAAQSSQSGIRGAAGVCAQNSLQFSRV